jgi:toxin FitB
VKFLVDANVLSEPTRPEPCRRVVEWLQENESELTVNPIVLGELEYGILLLPAGRRRTRLQEWFTQGIRGIQVLDFDTDTASVWAQLLARLKRTGLAMPIKDSQIAASAILHDLIVATRNVTDYRNASVSVVNPFEL